MAETLATGVRRTELEGDHAETIDHIFSQAHDGPSAPWLEIWLNEQQDQNRLGGKPRR